MPTKLLTVQEVSEQLTVAASTVFGLVDQGLLAAIDVTPGKKRRTLRFKPTEVEEFMQRQQVASFTPKGQSRPPKQRLVTKGLEALRKFGYTG